MLERFEEEGYQVYTCDQDGTFVYLRDGDKWSDLTEFNAGDVCTAPLHVEIFIDANKDNLMTEVEADIGPQKFYNNEIVHEPFIEGGNYIHWGIGENPLLVYADPDVALNLSKALFNIIYPDAEGQYAQVFYHPSYVEGAENNDEYAVLAFKQTDTVPISLQADPSLLASALQITVDEGALTQEEVDNLVGAISLYAGQEINLVDFIPESWQSKIVDFEEAQSQGYNIQL